MIATILRLFPLITFFVMWIVAVHFEFLIPLKVYLFFTKRISQLSTYLGYLKPFLWKPHRPWQHITQRNRAISEEPSILFDLCKVSQVNSQALKLNLPFQFWHLYIWTRHRPRTLKGMAEEKGGWGGNQSYQFPLKFKPPLVSHPSIHCSFTQLHVGLFRGAHI